ncbi:MAG: 1-deoxy-D-xylulose-5-phosphate reductoisomerase, partial [Boseongicola sp.]
MRKVSIFGSTGSIGCNTIDLVRRSPAEFDVVALTGGRNIARLADQAKALGAETAVTAFEECLPDLRDALSGSGIEVAAGEVALCE